MPSRSRSSEKDPEKVVMVMNMAYDNDCSIQGERFCFDRRSPGLALHHNIWAWCKATGVAASVTVHVEHCSFRLHKYPLVSKSGYLKEKLSCSSEISLNIEYEIFELVANFCYGSDILMFVDSANIASLICAADVLEMTEEYFTGNLCKVSDLYFNDVILKSWEGIFIVLQKCDVLFPLAEEISQSCLESLAFMVLMKANNFKQRKLMTGNREIGNIPEDELWMEDVVALSSKNFEKVVEKVRGGGLDESVTIQLVILYASTWILSEEIWAGTGKEKMNARLNELLRCILKLLPVESQFVPCDFLFSLLETSMHCRSFLEYRTILEEKIALQLDQSTVDCFLYPNPDLNVFNSQLESMKRIVFRFLGQQSVIRAKDISHTAGFHNISFHKIFRVVHLWDEYIYQIAGDERLTTEKFRDLIAVLPASLRSSHDLLYKAMHAYLIAHPHLCQEERLRVCEYLNCQKLSEEAYLHAIQNDLMPLQLLVRSMVKEHLQARQDIKVGCQSMNSSDSSYLLSESAAEDDNGLSLGLILKKDAALHQAANIKSEYEATSRRLKNLEEELSSMKESLVRNRTEDQAECGGKRKSRSFRILSTSRSVDIDCSTRFRSKLYARGNWFSQRKSHRGGFVKNILKSFERLGLKKRRRDENDHQKKRPEFSHLFSSTVPTSASGEEKDEGDEEEEEDPALQISSRTDPYQRSHSLP